MTDLAQSIAQEWCYPEEHHSYKLSLTYHCADDSKSARVPRIDVRGEGVWAIYIGQEAVNFLAALNGACQELLRN